MRFVRLYPLKGGKVYSDWPLAIPACLPLRQGCGQKRGRAEWEGFFFMLDTPGCLGTEEKKIWTMEEWQK